MHKKGIIYKKKDTLLATKLIEMVEKVFLDRDQVEVNLKINTEYSAAYWIIAEIRKVDNNDNLIIATIDNLLDNYFWFRNINSLHMLKSYVVREAVLLNKQMKKKNTAQKIRQERLEKVFQGRGHVAEYTANI